MDWHKMLPERLKRELRGRLDEVEAIRGRHGGNLTNVGGDDAVRVRQLNREMDEITKMIEEKTPGTLSNGQPMVHPMPPGGYGGGGKLADQVALTKGQSVADWSRSKGLSRREEEGLSLAKFLRGYATGNWEGADRERKGMVENTIAGGGALVPSPLSGSIIDLVRNTARVFQAGAVTVPMTSATLAIARQTGDPTGVWHAESTADIAASALTFDRVTFTARSLIVLVRMSLELLEDAAAGGGADPVVRNAIAKAVALELDSKALYGAGGGQNPTGVKNQSGITTQSMGTNGATPTNYDFLVDAIAGQQLANFQPNAAIDSPRTEQTLAKLKDTLGQPMRAPDPVQAVPRLSSNQVPVNITQGTSNNCSDLFLADWSNLLVGMRTELQIRLLDQRFLSDTGEFALFAHLRADVQLAHPLAFTVVTGVKP